MTGTATAHVHYDIQASHSCQLLHDFFALLIQTHRRQEVSDFDWLRYTLKGRMQLLQAVSQKFIVPIVPHFYPHRAISHLQLLHNVLALFPDPHMCNDSAHLSHHCLHHPQLIVVPPLRNMISCLRLQLVR